MCQIFETGGAVQTNHILGKLLLNSVSQFDMSYGLKTYA